MWTSPRSRQIQSICSPRNTPSLRGENSVSRGSVNPDQHTGIKPELSGTALKPLFIKSVADDSLLQEQCESCWRKCVCCKINCSDAGQRPRLTISGFQNRLKCQMSQVSRKCHKCRLCIIGLINVIQLASYWNTNHHDELNPSSALSRSRKGACTRWRRRYGYGCKNSFILST